MNKYEQVLADIEFSKINSPFYNGDNLSDEERVSLVKNGYTLLGQSNYYGQPLLKDKDGNIISFCRMNLIQNTCCNVIWENGELPNLPNKFTNAR